jgi:site-specific DNA recombinase
MKPLIPYMRKSSGEDPEQSRDRQRRAIRAWAELNSVPLAPEVWEGRVSGSRNWRERELGQAIVACERGAASGIIVEEQSRLSRENLSATAEVWDSLERAGARLVCAAEGLDTSRGDQELVFSIRAALAREQWKQYARRVEAAKRNAVARGIHIGPAPFGYRHKPHQPLEVNPAAADAVRAAFELRVTSASYGSVVRLLDERAPGGPSGRGVWNRGTVKRLLGNDVYLGRARGSDGPPREGAHPALVEPETFAACRALARRGEREPARPRSRHLLSGLARCGACGHSLVYSKVSKKYLVYRCQDRAASGRCSAPVTAMAPTLEQLVDDAVRERFARLALDVTFVEESDDGDVSELHQRLAAARAKRSPFEDPEYVAALGLDAAKRALAKVDAEIAALEDELAERLALRWSSALPRTLGEMLGLADPVNWAALYDELRELYDLDDPVSRDLYVAQAREVIASVVDRVIVSRGERGDLAGRTRIIWRGEDEHA